MAKLLDIVVHLATHLKPRGSQHRMYHVIFLRGVTWGTDLGRQFAKFVSLMSASLPETVGA